MANAIFESGRFYAGNAIFDTELSANAKLVYLYLVKCADCFGKSWPAHKTIADSCSLSVTSVKSALQELKDAKKLTVSFRYREQGGKSSNLYMIMDLSKEKNFAASPLIFTKAISSKAKLIYFYLCRCAGKEGTCFPAHKTTAMKCSLGFSTVRKAIKELIDCAIIAVKTQFRKDNGQTSNLYTLIKMAVEKVSSGCNVVGKKTAKKIQKKSSKKEKRRNKGLYFWLKNHVSFFRAGSIENIKQGGCYNASMKELNPN
ncbi:helix-turn-helix domain-containing protein [Sinanaerobacter sp. ZZT-01]|uniref:helix-turn-helix domain-containing protein n=1 Tax=Sinanaerobacter sp. ZZT-01 TaxID=3111540 RepID=UPI002D7A3A2E|nr:helix-turn-helix domain-containing protein [Sinanaerobacter sp. ZZT-01]WRR94234.1 helix-turn-helix domain-containing protein [Sinanaerobacter sp. ZZT-01]